MNKQLLTATLAVLLSSLAISPAADDSSVWKIGTPIVNYWAGPPMTDATARQMAEGGWNLVWCANVQELDTAQRHELRGLLTDGLLAPATLDDPARREKLDALIARVSKHPAMYAYHLIDQTKSPAQPRGFLLGLFGPKDKPSHVMVVNLDYTTEAKATLNGPGELETFDPATSQWTPLKKSEAELNLPLAAEDSCGW